MSSKTRIKSFDALKLFTIFLVLWGHCIQHFTSGEPIEKIVYVYIYSFHMPLFMIISGYFATTSMSLSIKNLLKKKTVQLLLPCMVWGIILSVLAFIFPLLEVTPYLGVGGIWFLKSLFVCYIITCIGKKFLKNSYIFIIITMLIVHLGSIFNTFNLPIMYPCFLIGIYLRKMDIQWKRHIISSFLLSFIVFFVLLYFWNKDFWDYKPLSISAILKHQHYTITDLYKEIYRIIIGVFGSLTFIFLFYLLLKEKKSTFLEYCAEWGKHTLGIYILQMLILEIVMKRFIRLDNLSFAMTNFIIFPLLSIGILILCLLIIKVIEKSYLLNLLLLGKTAKA